MTINCFKGKIQYMIQLSELHSFNVQQLCYFQFIFIISSFAICYSCFQISQEGIENFCVIKQNARGGYILLSTKLYKTSQYFSILPMEYYKSVNTHLVWVNIYIRPTVFTNDKSFMIKQCVFLWVHSLEISEIVELYNHICSPGVEQVEVPLTWSHCIGFCGLMWGCKPCRLQHAGNAKLCPFPKLNLKVQYLKLKR